MGKKKEQKDAKKGQKGKKASRKTAVDIKKEAAVVEKSANDKISKKAEIQKLHINSISGGRICQVPVKFSFDSKFYFVCVASNVQVYGVASGEVVNCMTEEGGGDIVALQQTLSNKFQLYTFTTNGVISLWDYTDCSKLKSWSVDMEIYNVLLNPMEENGFLIFGKKGENFGFYFWSPDNQDLSCLVELSDKAVTAYDVSLEFKAFAYSVDQIIYWCRLDKKEIVFQEFAHERPITVLKFGSGKSLTLATGDTRGQIFLWHLENDYLTFTKMHWHSHRVLSLEFSQDGNYMYSGGEEAVLVNWQIDTVHKQFLPRLGSPILSISLSPDELHLALSHRDNSVKIISTINLNLEKCLMGLKYPESVIEYKHQPLISSTGGLVLAPHTGHVLLNSVPGSIQIWDHKNGKHILEMDISERPRVLKNDAGLVFPSLVQHAAVSADGEWMATIDVRDNDKGNELGVSVENCLKFWKYDYMSKKYSLVYKIERAHLDKVTKIEFHPNVKQKMLITCSLDKTFRIWKLVKEKKNDHLAEKKQNIRNESKEDSKVNNVWKLASTGFWKDLPVVDACFSQDGSLLAVAFEKIVTLWDPVKMAILKTFIRKTGADIFRNLKFSVTSNFNSKYLLATGEDGFVIWDVLSSSVLFDIRKVKINFVDVFANENAFILGCVKNGTSQYILEVKLCEKSSIVPYCIDKVVKGACVDKFSEGLELICFDDKYEMFSVSRKSGIVNRQLTTGPKAFDSNMSTTFSSIFRENQIETDGDLQVVTRNLEGLKLFNKPCHLLPVPSTLAESLMNSMVAASQIKKQKQNTEKSEVIEKQVKETGNVASTIFVGHPWNDVIPSNVVKVLIN